MLWIDWTRISWQRKDEFEAKPKELEGMVSTIMMKGTAVAVYRQGRRHLVVAQRQIPMV